MNPLELTAGDRFLHFKIVRLLGQGGMGKVYEAEHDFTKRRTALKLIRSEGVDDDMRERMVQEARSLAELEHPNIVRLYDANSADGFIWLAMEYLEGRTLRSYRNTRGPLPVGEALSLLIEICDGVAAAHEIHIVHRDLKPENIILMIQGKPKVLDFGAAKVLRRETGLTTAVGGGGRRRVIGTPEYMSPEHLSGERVDDRTDSYAMGVIAYELLARHPYANPDGTMAEVYETVRRHFIEVPRPLPELVPSVPGYVAEPIHRALAKQAGQRPSVAEMAAAFRAALSRHKAEHPEADSAPFEQQWTGPGSWAAHGPAVSLPRHVAPPSDPSRRVQVQVPGRGVAGEPGRVSTLPASGVAAAPAAHGQVAAGVTVSLRPVVVPFGTPPASAVQVASAKTERLVIPAPVAPVALAPAALPQPQAMTVVPPTVGPEGRASHPARVRARRTGVLLLLAGCCVAGAGGVVFFAFFAREPGAGDVIAEPAPSASASASSDAADVVPDAPDAGATGAADAGPEGAPDASAPDASAPVDDPGDADAGAGTSPDAPSAGGLKGAGKPAVGSASPPAAAAKPASTTKPKLPANPGAAAPASAPPKPPATPTAKGSGIDLPFGRRTYPTTK